MRRHLSIPVVFALAAVVVACNSKEAAPPPDVTPATGQPGPLEPGAQMPPGHPPIGSMPAGHPPMGGDGMGGMGGMGSAPTTGGLPVLWDVPDGWTVTRPSSSMRIAQFTVGESGGAPVECVVFGGILGGADANIERWIGQFTTADGGPATSAAKIAELSPGGLTVKRLDVTGTFNGGMSMGGGAGQGGENFRMLAATVEGGGAPVQVKMVGPADVIAANAEKFDAFLKSLQKPQ